MYGLTSRGLLALSLSNIKAFKWDSVHQLSAAGHQCDEASVDLEELNNFSGNLGEINNF